MKVHKVILIGICIILLMGNWSSSGEEAQNVIGQYPHVDVIAQTVEKLQDLEIEAYDTKIPIPVQSLLIQLRHQVCNLILETINGQWNTPEDIQQYVVSTLSNNGIPIQDDPYEDEQEYYTYDKITRIQIEHPPHHPDLIVAMITSWVMCGRDTAFYLFQKTEQEWRLIAVQETTDYEDIGDAQQSFQYAISPPDERGQFFVITAHANPWCSSFWKMLYHQVFRVGNDAYQPNILFQGEESMYKWDYTMFIRPTRFRIIFTGDASQYQANRGYDSTISLHSITYDVEQDQVTGIHFIPEDFLSQWLDMPWNEASRWVDSNSLPVMEEWYTKLREQGEDFYSFSATTPCEGEQDTWQMGITLDNNADFEPDEELCFILTRRDDWYVINQVSITNLSGCPNKCRSIF